MTVPIRTERHDTIALVRIDNPPVNALSAAVRKGLADAITAADRDTDVSAIVLACAGRTFIAGADISEFGQPAREPSLPSVIDAIEACSKPVVAAIHGTALGGGCEVTLGCHYRIASADAKIGTPEVTLGLIPGAGGTQRLPRLVGVGMALEMTAKGTALSAPAARDAGLIDRIASGDLQQDAIAYAREIASVRPLPRTSDGVAAADPDAVARFRTENRRKFHGFDAPEVAITCVEHASSLPFSQGAALERAGFLKLRDGAQSAALRHLFFAERKAAKIEGLAPDVVERPIARVGVIGAGTMGGGIAMNFLSKNLPVTIVEMTQEALDRGVATIRKNYESSAAKGRLTATEVAKAMAALQPTLDFEALAGCDLIIEAVYESMAVKQDIFGRLDALARPGAILASNTSYLDLDEIAGATSRPENVIGLHFFSPANVMKLLEVVRGARTAPDVLATAMKLARTIGKVAVVAGVTPGFIGNRMLRQRQTAAAQLLLEGASPEQIDRVHTSFGMPMGPFQMTDLAGVDIGWHRDPDRIESIRDALNAEGRFGQKARAGFYDYDDARRPSPSPRVAEIIAAWRVKTGTPQHTVTDQEIIERTLYPMINEGALILEEGKAQRASDIDVVWVQGYGWPRYTGGPMFWAVREGLGKIAAALERHHVTPAQSLLDGRLQHELDG